jgi:hypothetical protein
MIPAPAGLPSDDFGKEIDVNQDTKVLERQKRNTLRFRCCILRVVKCIGSNVASLCEKYTFAV